MPATSVLTLPIPRLRRAPASPDSHEVALLARLRDGDEAAYRTMVETYGPRMLGVARRRLTSEEDAEDAVAAGRAEWTPARQTGATRSLLRYLGGTFLTT